MVILVHLYGNVIDVLDLRDKRNAAGRPDILILEDAAQAHGACMGERMVGSLGDIAAFSFYPSKNLGALGDGRGIALSNCGRSSLMRKLRNHGSGEKYTHHLAGYNSRLDKFQEYIPIAR